MWPRRSWPRGSEEDTCVWWGVPGSQALGKEEGCVRDGWMAAVFLA